MLLINCMIMYRQTGSTVLYSGCVYKDRELHATGAQSSLDYAKDEQIQQDKPAMF